MESAHRERIALQRHQPITMCTGWPLHCICERHANNGDGLYRRFEEALEADDEDLARLLRTEIEHIGLTLRKR